MAYHFIAIASDYEGGRRIGWHYASNEIIKKEVIQDFLNQSEDSLGSVDFGIHKLSTDSTSWLSVIEKDSFFEDVYIIEDVKTFLDILSSDRSLQASDVAKFFLSIAPMTHLKLQKLLYFAYATYLEDFKKRLFSDPIVSFKYGPVIEEVYHQYKCYGKEKIDDDEAESFRLAEISLPTTMLKILLSEDGDHVLKSLVKTANIFGKKSANELVEISHVAGGPWDRCYKRGMNCLISDEVIEKYHQVELDHVENHK